MKMIRSKITVFSILMGIILVASGCTKSSTNDPTGSVKTAGTLAVSTLTSTAGGSFSPNNVMAIWVEDSTGMFVKSLLVYAATRKYDLTNWTTKSGGNVTDAITGATQSAYATRTCTWNGTNVSGAIVKDGTYRVSMELTDKEGTGNFHYFTFVKGTAVNSVTPANVSSFSNITLKWTPN